MELGHDPLPINGLQQDFVSFAVFFMHVLDSICHRFALERCSSIRVSQRRDQKEIKVIARRKEESSLKLCNECFYFFFKVLVH